MIGYVTLGVKDFGRAKDFYGGLFAEKGAKWIWDLGRIHFLSIGKGKPMMAVCEPYDKGDPTPGNGAMVAFTADSKEEVDRLHARAIELGASCDGPPGQRIPDRFYGAYVHDPDGNKICFYIFA
jgi:catechol 2,3-dioxygenase-like lactoylglutathione lyase family enzyme